MRIEDTLTDKELEEYNDYRETVSSQFPDVSQLAGGSLEDAAGDRDRELYPMDRDWSK